MAKLVDLDGLAYFYSKIKAMLADKLGKNDVATVATSGSYNDLSDKPTIPSAYTLPTASSTILGGVKVGNNISVSDGTISLNKSNVTSALGYTPPTSDTVYNNATTTTAGLMSASDKVKLNNIADNANNYIHPPTHPASMITGLADVAKSGSYNDLADKPNIPASATVDSELSSTSVNPVQNKVINAALNSKADSSVLSAYLPLTGGTCTGSVSAPNFQTGTAADNYFQCRRFRGEGDANSYYHAIDFGYSGHDSVDFYEYDANWNFYQCTTGTKDGAVLVGNIDGNGWNGGARLSGTPTAPTAAVGTNTTQIATTAFVQAAIPTNVSSFTNDAGYIKTVNNTKPDSNGNVTITVSGGGSGVTVDEELSSTSTNPVQNKTIYNALLNKAGTDIFSGFDLNSPSATIRWRSGSQNYGILTASNYSGTALRATQDGAGNIIADTYAKKTDISNATVDATLSATSTNAIANKAVYSALSDKLGKTDTAYAATKATQDGNGNVISSTYIKSVNNVTPDENGNVNITVSGGGSNITVDAELSATSTNPVQNKVIKGALDDKANLNKNNTFSKENYFQKGMSLIAYRDLDSAIKWYQSTANPPIASIDATTYTGTAAKATSDGAGNVITETYAKKTDVSGVVKSVNGTKPDASGNVTVAVSGGGGVSTSESNTWTAQQNFRDLMLNREKYTTYVVNGTSDTPVISTMVYAVTGAFTLNLATLAGALSASQSSVFTAYFAANADYSLTISNAGKLKYTGIASDVAITTSGLLLNIWMSKDGGGTLTSIVQATKLS